MSTSMNGHGHGHGGHGHSYTHHGHGAHDHMDPSSYSLLQHQFGSYAAEGSSRHSSPATGAAPAAAPAPGTAPTRPPPYPFHVNQFDFNPSISATSTPVTSGSEDPDGDGEGDAEGEGDGEEGEGEVRKSGRAGNRRRQKYSRTRTGCLSCRTRRIKCDEGRPTCKRCIIAKKTCHWPTSEPEPSKKKKDGRKRIRSSEAPSESGGDDAQQQHQRKAKSKSKPKLNNGNDLGLYDYGSAYGQTGSLPPMPGPSSLYPGMPSMPDIPASDFAWDQTHVGSYDPVTSSTFASLISNTNNAGGSGSVSGDGAGSAPGPASASASGLMMGQSDISAATDVLGGIMEQKKWGPQGGAPMFNTPNFLLPWFPTAEERSLILHYCANAADLMMAIPSGLNPMLAINLPLALDSPRGVNPSADALRVALLGIGAVHQAFLLARSGVSTAQTATMFQYASNLRDTGKEMVRRAAADGTGAGSDAALGAGTALATIDIFFGGGNWMDNFKLAKEMIAYRGGPAEMLKVSKPRQLAEGVTMSPARLMLEILAIYETFGCLTTGQEPTLISDKWESWWFEGGRSSYEEHSVEKQFGMSRVMVHLFSRLTRLIARVSRFCRPITETDLAPSPPRYPSAIAGEKPEPTTSVIIEARSLKDDVDAWIESLQLATLEHERVQVGNRAYAYAMKILLLRMVFGHEREDDKVQDAALQVLTHCSTSTALLGMSIDLTWPAIIAGCCVDGTERRQWLMTLLEGFKAQCCFDIETASTIIVEVWRRVDAGEPRADWKPVCEDLGLQVLLC